ncbi:MAG: hypothetical protein ACXWB9_08760 [Flavisolibacter sp.]
MNRNLTYILLAVLAGCTMPEEKTMNAEIKALQERVVMETQDSNAALIMTSPPVPQAPPQKLPAGIYQAVLPMEGKMEQTISFNSNYTYNLQERYLNGVQKDSVVQVTGTWSPSNGFIWLYKEQIVRGRYKWKGDTLQYYNPESNKAYFMQPLENISRNAGWMNKAKEGALVYAIGNEPSWSVEVARDSIFFFTPELQTKLHLKLLSSHQSKDSTIYLAGNDTTSIRLAVLPYFCSDTMSDYVYSNRVLVQFNQQRYSGCGTIFKKP